MSTGLPAQIDPIRLAEKQGHLEGEIPVARLHRLIGGLETDKNARFSLDFEAESEGRVLMKGEISAEVPVVCQRCLEQMAWPLHTEVEIEFVTPETPLSEEEAQDVILVDKPLQLQGLIEDELLLALPMVPMHEPSCSASRYLGQKPGMPEQTSDEQEENSPFAVLAKLKLDGGNKGDK